MKWIPGLVSVSFRELLPDQILSVAKKNGLEAIEWGGDVHVPFGKLDVAEAVRQKSKAEGLLIPEYGSYYELGNSLSADIDGVIASARSLETSIVRLWAFHKNRTNTTDEEYMAIVADAKRICDLAPDITFCLECHINSLTEDYRDTLQFLTDVDRNNLKMFWQPNQWKSHEENKEACRALLSYICAVHVFSWEMVDGNLTCLPLAAHADRWKEYIEIIKQTPMVSMPMMLEFMHDGRVESLPETANTLLSWLTNAPAQ